MTYSKNLSALGFLATAITLASVGCTQAGQGEEQSGAAAVTIDGSPDTATGVPQAVGAAAAPAAAVNGASYEEIARGYVTQLKNFPTYNNPTGGNVRVHIQGCAVTSVSLSLLASNSYPVNPVVPAGGVRNFDGSVDMYWSFPAQNLGYLTLWAFAAGDPRQCYMTVSQNGGGGAPPPPPQCGGLSEFACITSRMCTPQYNFVQLPTFPPMVQRQYAGCSFPIGLAIEPPSPSPGE